MRLGIYVDSIYHQLDGRLYVHRAFPMFAAGLAAELDGVTLLGRLDPTPGTSHYELPADVEFVALPHYASLSNPLDVARAVIGALRRFWGVLDRVDAVWLLGPHPLAVLMAGLAAMRRKRIFIGVRQNTLEYARSRHPGNRLALLAFRGLDGVWRRLGRRVGVTAVGPELAGLYARSRRLFEMNVSLVKESDIAPESVVAARDWDGERRVLSVGRLETEKNPLLLADITAGLEAGGHGDWRLQIVGEGPMDADLRERLANLGVSERADLLGYVPIDRGLHDLYRGAHAFLHVSWTEGLPQVLFEAFAARTPVVATDVGGVAAAAGDAALLVAPGDAAAAVAALERLAAEPELRDRLVEAGLERVRRNTAEAERRRLADWLKSY